MNLDELRTFLEIVDAKSLAAASQRLHVTPSTITARLNSLEQRLGSRLLHRHKTGAELTSAGFKLQRYAELMTQLWKQAQFEVALPPGVEAVCNLGLDFDLWRDAGALFLEHVRAARPGVAVALWPGDLRQLHRWLGMGLIDVALCHAPQPAEGFTGRFLFEDELVMVSALPGVPADAGSGYVYVDHGDEFRRQHAAAFPHAIPSLVTIAASEWALEYIRRSGGKGYLPVRLVKPLLASRELHRVRGAPSFKRRVYVVENAAAVAHWDWYAAALKVLVPAPARRRKPALKTTR